MIVCDCPVCGALHPVYFDAEAGIDGDVVFDCHVGGYLEASDPDLAGLVLREVVCVQREEA